MIFYKFFCSKNFLIFFYVFIKATFVINQQLAQLTEENQALYASAIVCTHQSSTSNSSHITNTNLNTQTTAPTTTTTTTIKSSSNLQQQQIDYHNIVAPKPFKKSSTSNNFTNQVLFSS